MPPKRKPFSNWVLKPDVDGNMGWEDPSIPQWQRWWSYWRFEELPTGENLREKNDGTKQTTDKYRRSNVRRR